MASPRRANRGAAIRAGQKELARALSQVERAAKAVDTLVATTGRTLGAAAELKAAEHVAQSLARLAAVRDLYYDADPSLVPAALIPRRLVDLHKLAELLQATDDGESRIHLARQIGSLFGDGATASMIPGSGRAMSAAATRKLVRWCLQQPRLMPAVNRLDALLDSPRRWVRFHAAAELAKLGAPVLWRKGELDRGAVTRWRDGGRRLASAQKKPPLQ